MFYESLVDEGVNYISKILLSTILFVTLILLISACTSSSQTNKEDTTFIVTESSQYVPESNSVSREVGGGFEITTIDTSNIENQFVDITYGTQSKTQTLNVYLPNEKSDKPYPVIVGLHGGGFVSGSAVGGDLSAVIQGVNYGYAVVNVNYRLSGEAVFPAAVNDVKAAIRFIKANAEEYNLDSSRIAVWGGSAGANLAVLAGVTGNLEAIGQNDNLENLNYSSDIQAVIDWFGPINFLTMDEQFAESGIVSPLGLYSSDNSLISQYLGQNMNEDVYFTNQSNPETYVNYIDVEKAPYFYIEHGTNDNLVPSKQSVDLAEKLMGKIGEEKVKLNILDGAGHGTSEFYSSGIIEKKIEFLDDVLK